MSKYRVADYFTDGLRRWALVDNLGLVDVSRYVYPNIECPIAANIDAVIEHLFDYFKTNVPVVVHGHGQIVEWNDQSKQLLKVVQGTAYKIICTGTHNQVWFESGEFITCRKSLILSPVIIAQLLVRVNSSVARLLKDNPEVTSVTHMTGYPNYDGKYFGWVTRQDLKPNDHFKNDLPLSLQENPSPVPVNWVSTAIPLGEAMAFMVPPSLSVVPSKSNTSRIPAKEGSEAVWDADTMVKHILSAPCPLMMHLEEHVDPMTLSAGSEEPDPGDLDLVKQVIEKYLADKTPDQQMEEYLWMYVVKDKHGEFLKRVWDYSFNNKVGVVDAFKSIMDVRKPKWKPRFMMTLNSLTETTIRGDQGSLTIHHQTRDKFDQILKELYKLDELILIGENQIGASVSLKVTEYSKLTMENSAFIGSAIALKGENIFRNVIVEHGLYTDVRMNAKII